jgi:hypothetical protein
LLYLYEESALAFEAKLLVEVTPILAAVILSEIPNVETPAVVGLSIDFFQI